MIKKILYALLSVFVISYTVMFGYICYLNYILYGYFNYKEGDIQNTLSIAIFWVIIRFIGILIAPSLKDKNKSQYEELAEEINEIRKRRGINKK